MDFNLVLLNKFNKYGIIIEPIHIYKNKCIKVEYNKISNNLKIYTKNNIYNIIVRKIILDSVKPVKILTYDVFN